MRTLLLVIALLAQDEDQKRVDLLTRVAPALVHEGVEPAASWTRALLPLRYATRDYEGALADLNRAMELEPSYSRAYLVRGQARRALTAIASEAQPLRGFFVDDKGTFVTTASAKLGTNGKVRLHDGREVKATLLAREESLGLAVLKVEGAAHPLVLSDSSKIVAGRTLYVASRAKDSTVLRSAVVIGRDATLDQLVSIDGFLHLDYPALSSEMGSPVLNADGEAVGMLAMPVYEEDEPYGTKIHVPRRAYAIPSNTIKACLEKLQKHGNFEHGYLGITMMDEGSGVEITGVVPGGPAEAAGLKDGVIVAVDGAPVTTGEDLKRLITFRVGDKVEVALKDGRKIAVTVGVREKETPTMDSPSLLRERAGIEVTYLSNDLRRYLDLPQDGEDRQIISKVLPGGPAESAGLRKGDVILAVDQHDIRSESALTDQVQKSKKGAYSVFEVLSDGKKIKAIVTLN